jgi:hypothetical protein
MDQSLDRLQFELQLLRDRVSILEALVLPKTAPAGPRPAGATNLAERPEPVTDSVAKLATHSLIIPDLNLSAGMTTGARI